MFDHSKTEKKVNFLIPEKRQTLCPKKSVHTYIYIVKHSFFGRGTAIKEKRCKPLASGL